MDNKELANLIFPNAKEIAYYEEKYKIRNLTERSSCNACCSKSYRIYAHRKLISIFNCKKNGKPNRRSVFFKN